MEKDKQPWNPFPLACLKVEGLSACAKTVLIYLGVRSNYKGMTCVGHRTMCRELVRSKDFVTRGLAELVDKGFLSKSQRNRHKHQADWRTLNASLILKGGSESSPDPEAISAEEQDQTQASSPDFQKSSPDQQGKTLQINSNLPDEDLNLTDEKPSELVSEGVSDTLASLATTSLALTPLKDFLMNQYKVGTMPEALWSEISLAHPDFVPNDHNLGELETLLKRRDWRKLTSTLDDFRFRWCSPNPRGLYGQLQRTMVNETECNDCHEPGATQRNGAWLCAPCLLTRWKVKLKGDRMVSCSACMVPFLLPLHYDPDKHEPNVACPRCKRLVRVTNENIEALAQINEIIALDEEPMAKFMADQPVPGGFTLLELERQLANVQTAIPILPKPKAMAAAMPQTQTHRTVTCGCGHVLQVPEFMRNKDTGSMDQPSGVTCGECRTRHPNPWNFDIL
jgi:hypothetical protein